VHVIFPALQQIWTEDRGQQGVDPVVEKQAVQLDVTPLRDRDIPGGQVIIAGLPGLFQQKPAPRAVDGEHGDLRTLGAYDLRYFSGGQAAEGIGLQPYFPPITLARWGTNAGVCAMYSA